MTIETSRRSSTRASNARSAGSAWRSSARSASDRPAHSGRLGGERDADAGPARVGRDVLPARDRRARSRHGRCRGRAGRSGRPRSRRRRGPGARAAGSSRGSWRQRCTGTGPRRRRDPSARAASSRATASPARPQTARDPHLRCETWRRPPGPPARTVAIDSSSDAKSPSASLRMWVAYSPPSRGRRGDERLELGGVGVHPGRVDEPGRQADRARVERRLDARRPWRPSRSPSAGVPRCPCTDAADRPVTDEEGDVRPEPLVGDELEVLPERPPARGQAVRAERQLDELASARRSAAPAIRRSCPTAGSCSPGGDGWPARHRRAASRPNARAGR